jgi:hypothetical protein
MTNEKGRYIDLHTKGSGYLNRVLQVTPKEGKPFLAVTIAAIHGSVSNVQRTYFECGVYGEQAQNIVRELMPAVEGESKVFIGFTLSDLKVEPFLYKQGDKAGQPGANLKARLINIGKVKVDGEDVPLDKLQVA